MFRSVIEFFYKPGTSEIHKEKLISACVITIALVGAVIYGRIRNPRLEKERNENARYTIGITLKKYTTSKSPNSSVKYKCWLDYQIIKDFEEIPYYLKGKIVVPQGRYFVQYDSTNLYNRKLLLDCPVPDSITDVPDSGWLYMPGYEMRK